MITAEVTGGAYARINDVPAALGARTYAESVDLVLEVVDTFLPDRGGRFRLIGDPDGASVTVTDRSPDLVLTARQLASLYLGGFSARQLVTAGLLTEQTPKAARRFDVAFGSDRAAYCADFF
jgi:predicted acetyltransferase